MPGVKRSNMPGVKRSNMSGVKRSNMSGVKCSNMPGVKRSNIGTLNCPWNQSALVKRETCLARWYDEINYWATYCFLSENLNVVGVVTLLAS
mgnify:CR=1 FL=1